MSKFQYSIAILIASLAATSVTGANLDKKLIRAVKRGDPVVVQQLIDQGADIRVRDRKGSTTFQLASRRGHKDVVKVLQEAAYQQAYAKNTIQALEEFRDEFRYSRIEQFRLAEQRIEELTWENVSRLNTHESYRDFLKTYPKSQFKHDAELGIDELDWQSASRANTYDAFSRYLADHASGSHANAARDRMEEIESAAWDNARTKNTASAYSAFLDSYPTGSLAGHARDALLLDAVETSVVEVKFRAHRKTEAFWSRRMLIPALGGNAQVEETIEERRPDQGFYYFLFTVRFRATADFTAPVRFMGGNDALVKCFIKTSQLPWAGNKSGWEQGCRRQVSLQRGEENGWTFMWIVPEEDLKRGRILLGPKAYPLSAHL